MSTPFSPVSRLWTLDKESRTNPLTALVQQAMAGRDVRPVLRTIGGILVRLGQSLQGATEGSQAASLFQTVQHHVGVGDLCPASVPESTLV